MKTVTKTETFENAVKNDHVWTWANTTDVRATGYILCVEKTGPDLFCQPRPQSLLKMAADRTSTVVTSVRGCCANR